MVDAADVQQDRSGSTRPLASIVGWAGALSDPSVRQVAALASVFGVEPSYLLDRGTRRRSMKS